MTTVIDKNTWPRRAHYEFFKPMAWPFYTLTFPVDVTALRGYTKRHHLSFYYSMVFAVTKAMDSVEAFRTKCRGEDIVLHDALVPSFTDLKPGSDLFHIVTLEAGEDMADFCRRARGKSLAQTELLDQESFAGDEEIFFTCLPWFPVTALSNERHPDPADSVPRVAWGKYQERDGSTELLLSVELNHRLVDGVHVGRFHQALERSIAALEEAP